MRNYESRKLAFRICIMVNAPGIRNEVRKENASQTQSGGNLNRSLAIVSFLDELEEVLEEVFPEAGAAGFEAAFANSFGGALVAATSVARAFGTPADATPMFINLAATYGVFYLLLLFIVGVIVALFLLPRTRVASLSAGKKIS